MKPNCYYPVIACDPAGVMIVVIKVIPPSAEFAAQYLDDAGG